MTILQERERGLSSGILHLAGYGLLLIASVDIAFLSISPQWIDPLWEFQTVGAIVERIPVALLGMVLIYFGEKRDRAFIEILLLKILSYVCLMAAVFSVLVVPLNISNSFRIYHQQKVTENPQFADRKDYLQQLEEQLKSAESNNEISAILKQVSKEVDIPNSIDTKKLKSNIVINLQHNRDAIASQAQAFRAQKRSLLIKKCLKWNFGALTGSVLFFMLWKSTGWARQTISLTKVLKNG